MLGFEHRQKMQLRRVKHLQYIYTIVEAFGERGRMYGLQQEQHTSKALLLDTKAHVFDGDSSRAHQVMHILRPIQYAIDLWYQVSSTGRSLGWCNLKATQREVQRRWQCLGCIAERDIQIGDDDLQSQ